MAITFSDAVSARPVRLFQLTVVALVLLVLIFDGIDAQSLGLVVPIILEEWGVDRADFGWALSASLIGMGVGAFFGGWVGDRIGRLNTMFLSALVFGIATILSSRVSDVPAMTMLRFLGGLGFGAAGPNGLALASEWIPERWRTYVIALLSVGVPLGGTVAAGIAPFLLDAYGWRGMFALFGVLSIGVGLIALVVLKESPSYLLAKGKNEQAHALARKVLGEDIELASEQPANDRDDRSAAEAGVFSREYARLGWGASLGWSASNAIVYGIASWGTELFTSKGFSRDEAIAVIFWVGLMSVAGAIAGGYFVRTLGSRRVLLACSALTLVAVLALGALVESMQGQPGPSMLWGVYAIACAVGFIASLGISTIYQMLTLGYPVSIRAAGIGFGMMMGRPGGIAMAFAGGYLLNLGGQSTWPFFGVMVACALLVWTSAFLVDRHVEPAQRGKEGK